MCHQVFCAINQAPEASAASVLFTSVTCLPAVDSTKMSPVLLQPVLVCRRVVMGAPVEQHYTVNSQTRSTTENVVRQSAALATHGACEL